jgi:glycerophosphoryl diester phosphodiesterase
MKIKIFLLAGLLSLYSCSNEVNITNPVVDPSNFLTETTPLSDDSKKVMEGVYSVTEGSELMGDQVVVKWTRDRLSIFSGKNGGYIILDGGSLDSVLFFLGYWRYAVNTQTGAVNFYISSGEGGKEILNGDTSAVDIIFTGAYGSGQEFANKSIKLKYKRPFSREVKESDFYILAHRGGGRNSDYLGVSENTIEMINIAERFGATGIEIDARLSKDGVPFIYHDKDINLRLTQKGLIWGNIEDFTWAQIRTFITLRNGEKIPSLREVLEFVLEKTSLRAVWLDTKDVNVLPKQVELQKEINERAVTMGRDLKIFTGIPADDIFQAFIAYPGSQDILSLCELSIDEVRQANSKIWAPRWTQGTQNAAVDEMHAEGRKVFVWTLDEPSYIDEFINNGKFDGILSNYPTIVAYYYYIK